MRKRRAASGAALIVLLAVCAGLEASSAPAAYRHHGPALLNDLKATPGAARTVDAKAVCGGESTKDFRHTTPAMKKSVCLAYGLEAHCYGLEKNEIDHLSSLELGGADGVKNLWPQPYYQHPGAHEKDVVENYLHKQVCAGKVPLAEAQKEIASDWYAVYLAIEKEKVSAGKTGRER